MADKILDSTNVEGVTIDLVAHDGVSATLAEIQNYLQQLSNAYGAAGKSSTESFNALIAKLHELRNMGAITHKQFQEMFKPLTDNKGVSALQKLVHRMASFFGNTQGNVQAVRQFDQMAMAIGRVRIALWAATEPFKKIASFSTEIRKINTEMRLLAQSSMMTINQVANVGGLLQGFGGSANSYARLKQSFETAMEERRIGKGSGGVFTEGLMRYGISYNPNDFDATFRGIASFLADSRNTDAAKLEVKKIYGLTDDLYAAMREGNNAWQREIEAYKELQRNKDAASKATHALNKSTSRLSAAWQDLKDGVFVALEPILIRVTNGLTGLVNALNKEGVHKGIAALISAVAVLATFFAGAKVAHLVKIGIGAILGDLTGALAGRAGAQAAAKGVGGGIAGSIAGAGSRAAASSVGGGIAGGIGQTLGRTAGGFVGGVGGAAVSMVTGIVDTIGSAIQRGLMLNSLGVLEGLLTKWHAEWFTFIVARSGRDDVYKNKSLLRWSQEHNVSEEIFMAGYYMRRHLQKMEEPVDHLREQSKVPNIPYSNASAGGGYTVTVNQMDINVQSDSADPVIVAEEIKNVMLKELSVIGNDSSGVRA